MEQHFYVRLLGRFAVECNGVTVIDRSWSRRKAQALIKLLALRRDHAAHREEVLDQLWGELDAGAALNNLYKNLHHVRTVLASHGLSAPLVALNGEMVELASGTKVDVDEFLELCRTARQDVRSLETAVALYRGDLLPEDTYEEWTEQEREELRSAYVYVLFSLARFHQENGNHAASIAAMQALLRTDPVNEEAHRFLIAEYAHSGSKHRALRQYQVLTDALKEELAVEPSEETRLLYESLFDTREALSAAVADETPALSSTGSRDRNAQLTPTFGREDALDVAQELLDQALAGTGKSLLVWGEAGAGKSHFVNQLMFDAGGQGFRVLVSRCSSLESSSAYQPFRDALRELNGDPRADEFIRHSPYLRRILYGVSRQDEPIIDPNLFQTELFNDAYRLIQLFAQDFPLLMCLEDLHEADADSVRMFHFLARRISNLKVLLVASSRTEGPDHAGITPTIGSLRRDHQLVEVHMDPLPEQSMSLLIDNLFGESPPDSALSREIMGYAEGNPLYATEIVHTLIQEGWVRLSDGRWKKRAGGQLVIPSAVNELLDIRLKRLSSAAQEQVQIAAVYGRDIDYTLLRATLDLSEREVLDALDECIDTNIIVETDDGYRFRHELLREGIYERLTRVRRQTLHKILAQALEARGLNALSGPRVEEISHHYARSIEPWLALPYLLEAGRRSGSMFANEQAVTFYEQVLSLAEAHPDECRNVDVRDVLERLGDIERRRGNTARSVELFEQAQVMYAGAGQRDDAARLRGKAALGHIILGESDVARDQISATLGDLTSDSPQHVVSRTYYLLAQLHWHAGDNRAALEAAERALVASRDSDDLSEKAQAYEVLALACHSLGDWQRGVELELERQAMGVPGFDTDEAFEAHL